MNQPGIQVIDLRRCEGSFVIGYLDILMPKTGLIIYECKLCLHKDGKRSVRLPDRKIKKADGTWGWAPAMKFQNDHRQDQFSAHCLAAIEIFEEDEF